jgi:hypothetical protein
MPRDGALTFGDLDSRLDHLELACPKCGLLGRYSVKRLILARGRNGKVLDWIDEMTLDCPHRVLPGLASACGARCPDLTARVGGRDGPGPDNAA